MLSDLFLKKKVLLLTSLTGLRLCGVSCVSSQGLITLAIADWIAIVIDDWGLLSNQSEQSSHRLTLIIAS